MRTSTITILSSLSLILSLICGIMIMALVPLTDDSLEPDDLATPKEYDQYISPHIKILAGGEDLLAIVRKKKQDQYGNDMVVSNNNILIDTYLYEVELPDRSFEELSVNLIINEIVGHKSTGDVLKDDDAFIHSKPKQL